MGLSSLVISAPLTSPSLIMIQYALPLLALTTSVKAQNSISSCPIDSECIPIKTCAPIISQLSLAKETSDIEKKRKIISQVSCENRHIQEHLPRHWWCRVRFG